MTDEPKRRWRGPDKNEKTDARGEKRLVQKAQIKKNRKAHYSLMNIDAPPAAVAEMERRMGLSPDVLRFLTIRVDAHETEPSIQILEGVQWILCSGTHPEHHGMIDDENGCGLLIDVVTKGLRAL